MKTDRLKVYVASAYEDWSRTREAMKMLREQGHIDITHDWTVDADGKHPDGNAGSPEERKAAAYLDMNGVRDADIVLVLTPNSKEKGCGCWIELGGALFLGTIVYCTGLQRNRSVFHEFAKQFDTDEAAVADIVALSKRSTVNTAP